MNFKQGFLWSFISFHRNLWPSAPICMPVIFIYNHCIEKSPPTLSIKVVLGFPFGVQKRMQIR